MRIAEQFTTWSEAFDTCRERDRPLCVVVDNELGTCYPSGRFVAHASAYSISKDWTS